MTRSDRLSPAELAALTGVRSGKRSYYTAYVNSAERLQRTVAAMDSISRAVVRTVEGPRGLLEEVLRTAAEHLLADWALLVLVDGQWQGARPRLLILGPDGQFSDKATAPEQRPADVAALVQRSRTGDLTAPEFGGAWAQVPMVLEGRPIGVLAGRHGLRDHPEEADLSVLRILANQAAASLHTSEQYQAGLALHRRAQRLYDEASARNQALEERTRQLEFAQARLVVAGQRELIEGERARIARELHDSVAQHVLSAGMSVEVARRDAEALGPQGAEIAERLASAKALTGEAVDQLRRAIYALHQSTHDSPSSLSGLVSAMAGHYRSSFEVVVLVEGEEVSLSPGVDHEIARAVAEALFNVATHAHAHRAEVRLEYAPDLLRVRVCDDGEGDPERLAQLLAFERGSTDGSHRGLANIESRIAELGGAIAFRRAEGLGGVCVQCDLPLPVSAESRSSALIEELMGPATASTEVS